MDIVAESKNLVAGLAELVFLADVAHIEKPLVYLEEEMLVVEGVGDGGQREGPEDHLLALEDLLGPYEVRGEKRIISGVQHDGVVILSLANVGPVALRLALVEVRLEANDVVFKELDTVPGGLLVLWSLGLLLEDLVRLRSPRYLLTCDAFLSTFKALYYFP